MADQDAVWFEFYMNIINILVHVNPIVQDISTALYFYQYDIKSKLENTITVEITF